MTLRTTLTALALSVAIVGGSAAAAFASPAHHHHHRPFFWHAPVFIHYDYGYYDRAYYVWWWWHFRHTHHWHPYIPR